MFSQKFAQMLKKKCKTQAKKGKDRTLVKL